MFVPLGEFHKTDIGEKDITERLLLVFDDDFLGDEYAYFLEELKQKTGNDKEVQEYVMSFEEAGVFLEKLEDMMQFLIPNYIKEGKNRLVVAVGCTGGKHRSVTLANFLYSNMKNKGNYGVTIHHRDVGHGN